MLEHQRSPIPSFSVPTLHTERLTLRAVQRADIPAVQRNFEDWSTVRFLNSAIPWPYPENGASVWYETMLLPGQGITNWTWAICLKDSPDELIGIIELIQDSRPSNRGFWLDRNHRGNNYMAEAAAVVNDYAFNVLGFDKLIFDNAVGNVPSRKVKEKTGATFIGIVKATFVDPRITEMEHWELTKEAWQAHRSSIAPSPSQG